MKIAYLDCASGISGDMMLGALVDAGIELSTLQYGIDSLGLPSCKLVASEVKKNGFRATQITVEHVPEHAHRHLKTITDLIDASDLAEAPKELAKRIFCRLGEAEAKVHGTSIEKVHFHEVGAVDSIADIVGAALGWHLLGVDRIEASPSPTGTGTIQIAHGRCAVPAPATAELLKGVPLAASSVEAELTTPTGAALLATLVAQYGPLPAMTIERIGLGAGQRDLADQPNVLRLVVGQADDVAASTRPPEKGWTQESIWILETNLDDTPGEWIGYCTSRLRDAGALDVTTTPVQMKKDRPGVVVTVQCRAEDVDRMQNILIAETTTLGVRRWQADRVVVPRRQHVVTTSWGPVQGVVAWRGAGRVTFAPEYESCRVLAEQHHVAMHEVYRAAEQSFDPKTVMEE